MRTHFVLTIAMLTAAAASAPAMAQSRSGGTSAGANDSNRLICRRMPETGSLMATRRQCFTRAEWDRIAESARRGAERTVSELAGGFNGGN